MGFDSLPAPDRQFETSFILTDRHRDINRLRFAQAWKHTNAGGQIIMSGPKTDGIDAFIKEIKSHTDVDGTLPKSHGKVFWLTRTDQDTPAFKEWLTLSDPRKNADGYFTAAGMFSAAKVDPGSQLLVERFSDDIKGRVADLGAGWGYLSANLLTRAPKVTALDLIEADHAALDAAKLNVTDQRASFHWADATTLDGHDNLYDMVISNPPFHESRKSDPELGQKFIQKSARMLKANGRLLLVANRQLPYEKTLEQVFRSIENVAGSNGYKIILAKNPRPVKRR